MPDNKTPRFLAAAKEFNIGKDTLKSFLIDQGFDIPASPSPSFKLDADMYTSLQKEFAQDKLNKKESTSIDLPKGSSEVKNKTIDTPAKKGISKKKSNDEEELQIVDQNAGNKHEEEFVEKASAKTTSPAVENETPIEEKIIKEEVVPDEPIRRETVKLTGPKVIAKIDLDATSKKGRKKSSDKEDIKPEEIKPEKTQINKAKSEEEKPKETKEIQEEVKPEIIKPEEHQPIEVKIDKTENIKEVVVNTSEKNEIPVEEQVVKSTPITIVPSEASSEIEIEQIPTRTVKLDGPKVVGKIELPLPVERKKVENKDKKVEDKNKKRKRKRIIVGGEGNKPATGTTGDNRPKPGEGFNKDRRFDKRAPKPTTEDTVVDEKAIQDKIKETQARLSGGNKSKNLKAKYRKKKRDDHASKALEREMNEDSSILRVTEFITVSELASLMDTNFAEVIGKCMNLGIMVSINQRLDAEVIELVASEFNFEVEFIGLEADEEVEEIIDSEEDLSYRQPIVTIMGHVDHGKTSLLDYLRKSNITSGEAGGITQHIGAYEVVLGDDKKITFLDTPGHEAFTAMRARGAKVTDIAVIIIAADDAVMPQTKEAISHAQAANVPMIFAINKIDKEGANPERIKEQLSQLNILVEDWGGKFQCQEIAAKSGLNVENLLEKILLEAEMLDLKANPDREASGIILEATLDRGRGYVTNILVENGTLNIGDMVVAGSYYGKVKALHNEFGNKVTEVGPAKPIQLLGLNGAPTAGEKFKVYNDEYEAKEVANHRSQIEREQGIRTRKHITLDEIGRRLALGNFKELNVIIKADYDGSAEALADSLLKLSTEEVAVNVILKGVGQITESDVTLASASDAIILGFQVRPSPIASKLADQEGVEIRTYSIIYAVIDEIKSAMEGLLEPTLEKKVIANVEVRETFKISGLGTIAGCYVMDGKIVRGSKLNLIREGIVVYSGELSSLKRFKDDAKEVQAKMECGLSIKNYNDLHIGDIIEAYEEIEVKRTL